MRKAKCEPSTIKTDNVSFKVEIKECSEKNAFVWS